jgi:hypothetical protein
VRLIFGRAQASVATCGGILVTFFSASRKELTMCSPVPCSGCGKTTWSGCGDHVDEVMANVPLEKRCLCQ